MYNQCNQHNNKPRMKPNISWCKYSIVVTDPQGGGGVKGCKPWKLKGFFQFEINLNVFVSSF